MKLVAHRGFSGQYPENTMIAFEKAVEEKYDQIELDVRLSKDSVPLVIHDATINRTSNGGRKFVHDLTIEELKKYDFGSWFDRKFQGERIATLEEVLQLLEKEEISINIELKNGPIIPLNLEEEVLKLVRKYNMQDRTLYSSFDHQSVLRLYKLDPTIKVGLIFHINLVNVFDYINSLDMEVYSIHPNYFYVTEKMAIEAKKSGLKLNVYTVDDIKLARELEKIGVDSLITNQITKDSYQ